MTQRTKPVQKTAPRKSDVSDALGLDWHHVSNRHGKEQLARVTESSTKTIDRAITGDTLPEFHTAMASLLLDPIALQRTFSLYGGQFVPSASSAANDMETVASLSDLVTQFLKALEDGFRDHRETLTLAVLIAPLIARLNGILDEARTIEGIAA